jgi:hypothetical protein
LGLGFSVSQVEQLSARELDDWRAFYAVEPWGAWRENLHAGLVASTIANVNRAKGSKAFSAMDFMLKERDSSADQIKTAQVVGFLRAASRKGKKK